MKVASLHVDPQQGFSELCPTELPVEGALSIVDGLLEMSKRSDYVCVSKDAHPARPVWQNQDLSLCGQLISQSGRAAAEGQKGKECNADRYWPLHCVVGTSGGSLLPGLPSLTSYDFVVWKGIEPDLHPYGACYHDLQGRLSTGLIEWLKSKNIDLVLVGGLATDYCVLQTVLQLQRAGLQVVLCKFACKGIAPETTRDALKQMAAAGCEIVDSSSELDEQIQWRRQ
ncbi:isochorismatase family protein [Gregarina niphandrodes]|uniref:nicotinamidase n=1 Tax=Gregarina niphandrodes TaxID=110365 RepID=A0A023B4M9_GRENI|nr:isochorismatase family protein [Gregarina niphandrodes]EZG57136.1 isochorismatase family protein [Gregarina niphandrodes]|eukprot:XP_011131095.1 isochorismatase family protein [Gregarina niphandrodes]